MLVEAPISIRDVSHVTRGPCVGVSKGVEPREQRGAKRADREEAKAGRKDARESRTDLSGPKRSPKEGDTKVRLGIQAAHSSVELSYL
jgi:hypothetical protein